MFNIKKRIYISFVFFVLLFIIYFFLFNISFVSISFALLILLLFLFIILSFKNYFFDILSIEKLDEMIKGKNYNYEPLFLTKEVQGIVDSINILKSDISKLQDKSFVVEKMKEDFIYLVSHELRTPVTSSMGYIDILKSSSSLDNENLKILERLESNISDLNNIVEEILNVIFLESDDFKLNITEEKIKPLIENILLDFKNVEQISIGLSYDGPVDSVKIDKGLFEKIIRDILSNSIKFNKKDGIISILVTKENDFFIVKISDSGIGMSKSDLESLFAPFVRGTDLLEFNYKGLGLGLYIAKIAIEKMGGKISVSSSVNKGSFFSLYFRY